VRIQSLQPIDYVFDRVTRKADWDRLVPGLNMRIPWPDKADEQEEAEEHEGVDTLRIDAEAQTFVPTLVQPPMPVDVIDELRNRYSRFRTRHTDEYVAKKEAELAERQARKRSPLTMLTPVAELNRRQREIRRARGQPVLTDEMLHKIGEVMIKTRARRGGGGSVAGLQEAVGNLSTSGEGVATARPLASSE
jgi:large subunit ribosomal protein L24